jgi:hypothetical protein
LGIGTSSPSEKLTIDSGSVRLTDGYALGWGDNSARIAGSGSSEILQFYTNNAERMRIDSAGRIIVNSAAVSTGSGTNKGLLQVGSNQGSGYYWTDINTGPNQYASMPNEIAVLNTPNGLQNSYAGIFFQAGESSDGAAISAARIGAVRETSGNIDTALVFANRNGSSMAERMRIDSSGNVGIGTSSPSTLAHLKSSGDYAALTIETATTGGASYINLGDSNDLDVGQIAYYNSDDSLRIKVNASERMRITSTGSVGINTTSPAGSLQVDGGEVFFKNTGNSKLQINAGNTSSAFIEFGDPDDGNVGRILYSHANDTMQFTVNAAERVRIEGDGDLHADGDVIAYSTTISDPRLKTDIQRIEGALDKICTLSGYTFTYTPDGKASAGVLSTEVAQVLPSAIKPKKLPLKTGDDETVYDTVQYDQLHGLLIEAIKELRREVADLKAKIEG